MSGLRVGKHDVVALQSLLEEHALIRDREFVLSSGQPSKYYFNIKPLTMSATGFELVGRVMGGVAEECGADAVGGLEIGAIPLGLAVAVASKGAGKEIPDFLVRETRKVHGTKERIAASYLVPSGPGCRVAILDDVVTTGKSIDQAIEAVLEVQWEIVSIIALVTRAESGGVDAMRQKFAALSKYVSIFESDLEGNLLPLVDEFLTTPVG
jgi:orotate phosphoribosyltransferase